MTDNKKNLVAVGVLIVLLTIASMILAVIAFQDITKYSHPYIFSITTGLIGLLIGYFIWRSIKPKLLSISNKFDDGRVIGFIMSISVGLLFFAINFINISTAQLTECKSYPIINKYRKEAASRSPEVNTLVINIGNEKETIVCKHSFWLKKSVGDQLDLCHFRSFMGFNYYEINE